MIPARLAMRNFLCYADDAPPLDFRGIQVACLSGDNGAGKSAILDAITWALWGKARGSDVRGRSDDDLVYLGRSDMEVEFEFVAGEQLYRVVRKRHRAPTGRGASQPSLELHIAGPDGYRPITGNSLRETEQRIVDILRMDYDTFVHSAFLMQGRADQFTVSPPSKRKEVLAAILELDRYEELSERARAKGRELDAECRTFQAAIDLLERELAGRGQAEAELEEAEDELRRMEGELLAQRRLVDSLRGEQQALQFLRQQLEQAARELRRREEEVRRQEAKAAEQRRLIGQQQKVLADAEAIRRGYTQLQEARQEEQRLGGLLLRVRELEKAQGELARAVEVARANLQAEEKRSAEEVAALAEMASLLVDLDGQRQEAEGERTALASEEERARELRRREQEARLGAEGLRQAGEGLRQQAAELKGRLEELSSASGGRCPLCDTELGAAGLGRLREHYRQEIAAAEAQLATMGQEVRRRLQEAADRKSEAEALEAKVAAQQRRLDQRLAVLERDLAEAQAAQERLPQAQGALDGVRGRLAAEAYAPEERRRLAVLQEELAALGYDAVAHEQARRQVEALKAYEERQRQLERAEQTLAQAEQALAEAEEQLARWQAQSEEERERLREMEAELGRYPSDLEQRLAEAEEAQATALRRQSLLQERLGAARQRLDDLRQKAHQREEKQSALAGLAADKVAYEELAVAFGKNGLQALLIDSALPELEAEANQILARMTNNRMAVAIETQRERRSGEGAIETLDIRIADELGTRPYELYSGGEDFRINFALRVALSKLLARRKGAPLPTLIVDEGFGSLDRAGREQVVEAIGAIRDDFQCILVVTHIEELRDAFPVRIECTKTERGSVATVVRE